MIEHIIYTHNRVDDARILQEISRNLWAKKFGGVNITHVYNGHADWYQQYLEDQLITMDNPGHFLGAANMIDAGIVNVLQKPTAADYVLLTAADTWLLDADFLEDLLDRMRHGEHFMSASSWGHAVYPQDPSGLSTDLAIFDRDWLRQSQVFPLNYEQFLEKHGDSFYMRFGSPTVEWCFTMNYMKSFLPKFSDNQLLEEARGKLLRIKEREPVHTTNGVRQADWPEIGLYTDHAPETKQQALQERGLNLGKYSQKLMAATDLSYFNRT